MNIFKKLLDKAGKMALSGLQLAGLTAVVGAAGVGAWQYLSAPAEAPEFSLPQYNSGEVMYVSSAASGGEYRGTSFAADGTEAPTTPSSMRISTRNFKQLERSEIAAKAAEEMAENESYTIPEAPASEGGGAPPTGGGAVNMGAMAEGLGMGANALGADAFNGPGGLGEGGLAGAMAGIQNMVSGAVQQGQAAGGGPNGAPGNGDPGAGQGGEGGGAGATGGPKLASASPGWRGGGSGSGGGSGGGSSFVLQDSGKNKGAENLGNLGNLVANAQRSAQGAVSEANMRAQKFFGGEEKLPPGRNALLLDGKNSKETKELGNIRKRSVDAAKNKFRSPNEGARAFLASSNISGGLRFSTDNVMTGQGAGSKDFETGSVGALRGIRSWGDNKLDNEEELDQQRKQDRNKIKKLLWIALPLTLSLIPWIGTFADLARTFHKAALAAAGIPIIGPALAAAFNLAALCCWIVAGVLAAVALVPNVILMVNSIQYASKYGGEPLSTWGITMSGVMMAGIGAAFIPGVSKMLSSMKLWMATIAAPLIGVGSAWMINSMAGKGDEAVLAQNQETYNSDILENPRNQ